MTCTPPRSSWIAGESDDEEALALGGASVCVNVEGLVPVQRSMHNMAASRTQNASPDFTCDFIS